MLGKRADNPTRHKRPLARTPIASAAIATVVLAGGTYLGLAKAGPHETPAAASPQTQSSTQSPSPSASPSALERPPAPLSRGKERPPASAAPTTEKVTGTGSCGASFYDEPQHTANGEIFNPNDLTAAHKSLPFNTRVRVTNPNNGRSVVVRINDRGPYVGGRCLDLSRAAFEAIASLGQGVLNSVNYEVLS